MKLEMLDIGIFITYVLGLLILALWISREEKQGGKNTEDYFLASKSLPWWAIGASLIASNISAEQIIGMSGSGFAIGLAIASYEWMAAITLIIVGKYMLPIFLKNEIYTMPQYLEQRFDSKVKTTLALFWLAVYVFVNLTAVLWLGGLAIETVAGVDWMYGMMFLAIFSVAYSLYGGLKAVAYTDILQVVLLVFGGLFLSYLALNEVSGGEGVIAGFGVLTTELPGHFDMILSSDNEHYMSLPGISVLVGGMWIMNFSYWGFNQYIIQRALAAKSQKEAQKGIAFAAYLKLLMPIIVVLPGIAAVVLYPNLSSPDQAYPSMMALMPVGIKGLVFAALVAAIVSSLASMTNSISTIFTMDIYARIKPGKSQKHYVTTGRIAALVSLAIALVVAEPLLGKFDQAFQYIQEFTGFFTPGIVVIFVMGMFWSKATSAGALSAAIGSAAFSILLKVMWPELPFMDRVGLVFLLCLALCVVVSLMTKTTSTNSSVSLDEVSFETDKNFNIAAIGIILVLTGFYATWW
ncbi:sodium/sugar symporter [Psychrosphaera sp. B3R10]|uniref:sodium/sugar symporter n=1 Tax=unclassified Psychrosphaera TaxID=2641570 RepID=UPI001C09A8EB|nr:MULTISPECIES: sodium/sugar symporter [unclassified Psychrosphaera]MBU2881728.1 sodium/sugar symporter [Psychrosphaera sp. I2R16]MBU2990087.1 sodium/sugar symporter [Psychrosphaera sp. B3R10]